MFGIIYVITNTINGKQYVGQTIGLLSRRWWSHIGDRYEYDVLLYRAIRKYGVAAFKIEQIGSADSRIDLDALEIFYIAKLNTFMPNGYNMTRGGRGTSGYKHTERARKSMSKTRFGHIVSEKTAKRISETLTGHTVSVETRRKISKSRSSTTPEEANRRRLLFAEQYSTNFCSKGHLLDEVSAYFSPTGNRMCLVCYYTSHGSMPPEKLAHRIAIEDVSKVLPQKLLTAEELKQRQVKHGFELTVCKKGHLLDDVNGYINPAGTRWKCYLCYYLKANRPVPKKLQPYLSPQDQEQIAALGVL